MFFVVPIVPASCVVVVFHTHSSTSREERSRPREDRREKIDARRAKREERSAQSEEREGERERERGGEREREREMYSTPIIKIKQTYSITPSCSHVFSAVL